MKRKQLPITTTILLLAVSTLCGSFNFGGNWEGLYLLKGPPGKLFALQDYLRLGDYERLMARIEFQALYERWRSKEKAAQGRAYLKYSWSNKAGKGYFINFFPDGSKFLACFGRSGDDNHNPVKGLFVGGGLPKSHYETASLKTNETGVAYFDGREWQPLWENADEAIAPTAAAREQIFPAEWQFLGSKVLFASQYRLALKSSHLTRVGQIPVRIDRYLLYHAGDRFFTLINRLTNTGSEPLTYHYRYNDTATPGKSGAAGIAGWTRERRHQDAGMIDLATNSYAGSCNCGNSVTVEKKGGSGLAKFIAWQGDILPTTACFSNSSVLPAKTEQGSPDDKAAGVLLRWDSRKLLPGQSGEMILTIGMANNAPETGFPLKPAVQLDPEELRFLLSR